MITKLRVKRTKRLDPKRPFNLTPMDNTFMKGFIYHRPEKGRRIIFHLSHSFNDYWTTTPVQEIKKLKTVTVITTRNSVYHMKKGWGK